MTELTLDDANRIVTAGGLAFLFVHVSPGGALPIIGSTHIDGDRIDGHLYDDWLEAVDTATKLYRDLPRVSRRLHKIYVYVLYDVMPDVWDTHRFDVLWFDGRTLSKIQLAYERRVSYDELREILKVGHGYRRSRFQIFGLSRHASKMRRRWEENIHRSG